MELYDKILKVYSIGSLEDNKHLLANGIFTEEYDLRVAKAVRAILTNQLVTDFEILNNAAKREKVSPNEILNLLFEAGQKLIDDNPDYISKIYNDETNRYRPLLISYLVYSDLVRLHNSKLYTESSLIPGDHKSHRRLIEEIKRKISMINKNEKLPKEIENNYKPSKISILITIILVFISIVIPGIFAIVINLYLGIIIFASVIYFLRWLYGSRATLRGYIFNAVLFAPGYLLINIITVFF